jgi:GT2 family glycosyltransferase
MSIRASIVVPTYRRPALLDRCLAALAAQDFPAAEYEIIVCDDAASEETRKQVADRATRLSAPALRYVAVTRAHGPAAARNRGWQAAQGPIIAFTDDDCIPDTRWLMAGIAAVTEDIAVVWGRVHVPLPAQPTDYERNEAGLERAGFVTANCFCRRDVLARVHGFDERFTTAWREDSDLYLTLLEHGYQVQHAPDALVVHPVRPAGWAVCLGQQRKSQFNALLYKKHPMLYCRHVQPHPPWHYCGILLGLLLTLTGVAAGLPSVAICGAIAWMGLTAWFCTQRLRGVSHAPGHVAEMAVTSLVIPFLSIYWRLRGAVRFRVPFI